jgi:hypothetical protein
LGIADGLLGLKAIFSLVDLVNLGSAILFCQACMFILEYSICFLIIDYYASKRIQYLLSIFSFVIIFLII